jgi:hypothetical protein
MARAWVRREPDHVPGRQARASRAFSGNHPTDYVVRHNDNRHWEKAACELHHDWMTCPVGCNVHNPQRPNNAVQYQESPKSTQYRNIGCHSSNVTCPPNANSDR